MLGFLKQDTYLQLIWLIRLEFQIMESLSKGERFQPNGKENWFHMLKDMYKTSAET